MGGEGDRSCAITSSLTSTQSCSHGGLERSGLVSGHVGRRHRVVERGHVVDGGERRQLVRTRVKRPQVPAAVSGQVSDRCRSTVQRAREAQFKEWPPHQHSNHFSRAGCTLRGKFRRSRARSSFPSTSARARPQRRRTSCFRRLTPARCWRLRRTCSSSALRRAWCHLAPSSCSSSTSHPRPQHRRRPLSRRRPR